ncbi:MAG: transposase [Patescibacteria group bacterium]
MRSHNFIEGEFYHIYVHGIGGLKIFQEEKDYKRFLTLLFSANGINIIPRLDRKIDLNLVWDIINNKINLGNPLVDIVCFSLMPTHFHLLLRERKDGNISKYLHKILVSHSKYFNIKYERRGHLFESNFHSRHIDNNDYFLVTSCYIHKNSKDLPGWKNKEDKYPWSSYQDFISENRWQHLLKKDIIDSQFKNSKEYKNFIEEHYKDEDIVF